MYVYVYTYVCVVHVLHVKKSARLYAPPQWRKEWAAGLSQDRDADVSDCNVSSYTSNTYTSGTRHAQYRAYDRPSSWRRPSTLNPKP